MLQLRSSDWTVRERAAKQLGDLQDTRAVSALATLLGGRTPLLISRKAVGTFLEELLGDPDAVPNECDRYPVQQAAAKALGQIGDARAVPALIAALEDAELYVQIEAAHALGLIGDARAGNPLASVLRSQVAELRDTAVEALARLGAAPVPALLDLLDRSKFSTREAAARALGVIGALEAVPSLIAALNDPDSQVRKAVVDSLAKIEKKAEPLLIAALRDPCVSVRLASANALGKIKDPCAIMPLVEASKDASPDVREAAWQALAALHWPPALVRQQVLQAVKYGNFQRAVEPGGAAVESLVEVFRSGNKAEREKVTKMLEQIGHSAVPPLLTALVDDDREVRHLAAAMLKALGWQPTNAAERVLCAVATGHYVEALAEGTAAYEPLVTMMESSSSEWDRKMAAKTLGELGDPRAVERLLSMLCDPDFQVREAVATALGQLGGDAAMGGVNKLVNDGHYSVRCAAKAVLTKLGHVVEDRCKSSCNDSRPDNEHESVPIGG